MGKNVTPGMALAYSEEYLPGNGIYDDGERLRAALFGEEFVDAKTMEISVRPAGKGAVQVEVGDVIVGVVTFMKPDLASVKLMAIRGKRNTGHQAVEGTLHVSKSDDGYVDDLGDLLKGGDVIRAKVVGLKGGPQLATDSPEFGVLVARSGDGNIMDCDGRKLFDPVTGRVEKRKLTNDYRSGIV